MAATRPHSTENGGVKRAQLKLSSIPRPQTSPQSRRSLDGTASERGRARSAMRSLRNVRNTSPAQAKEILVQALDDIHSLQEVLHAKVSSPRANDMTIHELEVMERLSKAEFSLRVSAEQMSDTLARRPPLVTPPQVVWTPRESPRGVVVSTPFPRSPAVTTPRSPHRMPLQSQREIKAIKEVEDLREQQQRIVVRSLKSSAARREVCEKYGLSGQSQQRTFTRSAGGAAPQGNVAKVKVALSGTIIPKWLREDPHAFRSTLEALNSRDFSKGLLHLLNVGALPRSMDLTNALIGPGVHIPKFRYTPANAENISSTPDELIVQGSSPRVGSHPGNFYIRMGCADATSAAYMALKQAAGDRWSTAGAIIGTLEGMCQQGRLEEVAVDPEKLLDLASDVRTRGKWATPEEIMSTLADLEQVIVELEANSRSNSNAGTSEYNNPIYAEATEKIQRCWRRGVCRAILRERISKRNASNATTFDRLQTRLRIEWQRVCNRRRLLIHVPSFSVRRSIRDSTPHFPVDQSSHLASALCGLMDPHVDVIYVAPSPPPDGVVAQTFKMLEEGEVRDPRSRFRIVFPENHARLPAHFSLTMSLLLSPKALKRIRLYSSGRTAILMPWHVAQSELDLAVALGLPLMGTHPDVASQLGTKIGMRQILKDAGVSSSPAVAVSSEEEVIAKMADLIVDRPLVPRWLVKIDDESGGRGHAYFDVLSVNTIAIIITNIKQNIEEYAEGSVRRREVTGEVRLVLSRALASRMVMVAPSVHATWQSLVASMRDHKAIVEAVPGTVRGSPSANLFLDPCGNVSLLSTHEQVFEPEYRYVGALFPQRSVPHGAIVEAATQIGRACAHAGVIGHVGVDFVVFEHKGRMRLWAVDLNLRPTRTHASYTLFHFLCRGLFQPALGRYSVGSREAAGVHAHEEDGSRARFYAVADAVCHPAFADLHRSGLLIACKRSELTFRPQDKEGVVWGASEGLSAGRMDVLAIASTAAKAAKNVTSALAFLADQIGKRGQMTEGRLERSFSNSRKAFSLIADRLEAKEATSAQPHSPTAAS